MNELKYQQLRDIILKYTSQKYSFVQYIGFKDIEEDKQILKIVDTLGDTEYYFYLLPSFGCYIEAYNQGTLMERSRKLTIEELIKHKDLLLDYDLWYLMNR